jgi:hypothetical protein
MRVRVECYAGHKDSERPLRFLVEEHSYVVSEVLDQWYAPEHLFFKARADDGNVYILLHETSVTGTHFREGVEFHLPQEHRVEILDIRK